MKIVTTFKHMLHKHCPKTVKIEFARHGLAGAVLVPHKPAMTLAAEAVRTKVRNIAHSDSRGGQYPGGGPD